LNVAQGFFRRAENQDDFNTLEALFEYWRDMPEYMILRSTLTNPKTYASCSTYVAVKCSKRGNDVYGSRVKKRLDWLSSIPNVKFFDVKDFSTSKSVSTSALWLTLTYDSKRCSRFDAWENVGVEWNRFVSALKQRYGEVSILRTWESFENGYPHIHAVLLFKEAKFTVFPYLSMDEGEFSFRIEEKNDIADLWHSHVDVQAVSSTKKLFNYMRKYQTKTLMNSDSLMGVKTMALMWLFRKRGFSVSGDFRIRLSDLIRVLHNSKMVLVQSRLDGSVEPRRVWEFVGVFSSSELGYRGDSWSFRLSDEQVEVVLARQSRCLGFDDYD